MWQKNDNNVQPFSKDGRMDSEPKPKCQKTKFSCSMEKYLIWTSLVIKFWTVDYLSIHSFVASNTRWAAISEHIWPVWWTRFMTLWNKGRSICHPHSTVHRKRWRRKNLILVRLESASLVKFSPNRNEGPTITHLASRWQPIQVQRYAYHKER